jgi:hypothetical protein
MPAMTRRPTKQHASRQPTAEAHPSRLRAWWAAVLAVALGLLFTATTSLTIMVWLRDTTTTETNPVVDVAFFALGGVLIAGGLASQIRGRQVAGLQQAFIALVALTAAGLLGGRIEPFVGGLVLLVLAAPLGLAGPVRAQLFAPGEGLSRPLAALGAVAVIPAVAYASSMLGHARAAGPSCFLGQCAQGDRFAEAAALAVAVVLVTLLAALRTTGWLLPAWCAGTAGILVGSTSLLVPQQVGALAVPWAILAAVWGVAVIATAQFVRRRGGSVGAPLPQRLVHSPART